MTDFHKPEQPGKAAALLLAVELLAAPIKDRPREFQPFQGHALLMTDSGGECVTRFDDATAVHYFLKWLREERAIKQQRRKSEARAALRRQNIKLVGGGKK